MRKISDEEQFVKKNISQLANGIVFDVGANIGNYSTMVRKYNSQVQIFAFEPHPATFKKLQQNTIGQNIELFNVGAGSNVAKVALFDSKACDGSPQATLYKGVFSSISESETAVHLVDIILLDEFVVSNNIEKIDLIKIDTEGHEIQVIKGLKKFISEGKVKMIQFEFNEMNIISRTFFKDFWDFLPNYTFYRLLPFGMLPIREYSALYCEIFAYQNIVAILKK